jgi:hypothetical protein
VATPCSKNKLLLLCELKKSPKKFHIKKTMSSFDDFSTKKKKKGKKKKKKKADLRQHKKIGKRNNVSHRYKSWMILLLFKKLFKKGYLVLSFNAMQHVLIFKMDGCGL